MADRVDHYYTFTKLAQPIGAIFFPLRVTKWDEFGEPLASYEMRFNYRVAANACDCPAYRACKHVKAVYELWQRQKLGDIQNMRWDEVRGWHEHKDILDDLF